MSKFIYTTNSGSTIVDDEDYEYLMQWNWQIDNAVRRTNHKTNKPVYMHRVIAERMGLNIEGLQIDHKDRNPLNNQRSNLRIATQSQNKGNSEKYKNNTSDYKGIRWHEKDQKWHARI